MRFSAGTQAGRPSAPETGDPQRPSAPPCSALEMRERSLRGGDLHPEPAMSATSSTFLLAAARELFALFQKHSRETPSLGWSSRGRPDLEADLEDARHKHAVFAELLSERTPWSFLRAA